MDQSRGILLLRLKSLGDILFTLPAVHAVRSAFPQGRVAFLVSKEYAPLLQGFRDVNQVISLDRSQFRGLNPRALFSELISLIHQLREGKFSVAIDFQGYGETAFLVRCSAAPERWGNVQRLTRRWAYTRVVPRNDNVHPIDSNLALLRQAGLQLGPPRNEFVLPQFGLLAGERFFLERGLRPERPTLFIQPFTSAAPKNWPLENFLAIASYWQKRGMQILFGGGPADRGALEAVCQAGFHVSAGVPLLTSAGLANLSALIVGGDTGLVHLALAMNKRVLMLIGSNTPGSTHPFEHPDWTVLPRSGKPLSTISVETVNEACFKALSEMGVSSAKSETTTKALS